MALATKLIKGRLRSIANTRKITKAMEMVAATKMRKAVNAVLASRAYSQAAWQTVLDLVAKIGRETSPLLKKKEETEKIGLVLITSNRGLCGGFNNQIISAAIKYIIKQQSLGKAVAVSDEWLVLGKKGGEFLVRNKKNVVAQFEKLDIVTEVKEVTPLANMIINDYLSDKYDQIMVAYTDFVSPLVQKPRIKKLLPLEPELDQELGSIGQKEKSVLKTDGVSEYLFEPNPTVVLNQFLPRLIEIQLYQALLEANASEHSARMAAMKNASEAAADMIDELTLAYNQARQAGITKEIAEIAGGKAALE